MTIQAIQAQPLKPAFKAEPEEVKNEAATVVAEEPEETQKSNHTAAKVIGGATALALLGLGLYKVMKGKAAGVKSIKDTAVKISENITEYTSKKGEKIRIYQGKDGGQLVTVKNKDGELTKMIRRYKDNSVSTTKAEKTPEVNLEESFNAALEELKEQRGIPKEVKLEPMPKLVNIPQVATPDISMFKPQIKTAETQDKYITVVTNYVNKDGSVSKKPVITSTIFKSEEGVNILKSSPKSDYMNATTVAKDGTKTLTVSNINGEELGSVKFKDGKILEQSKNMSAKFDENGKLTYTIE